MSNSSPILGDHTIGKRSKTDKMKNNEINTEPIIAFNYISIKMYMAPVTGK